MDPGSGDVVDSRASDADSMYRKLQETIVPMYYGDRDRWIEVMRYAIALNGSFFNSERMIDEYVRKAYAQ
jgi:starch phosphorylase